MQYVTALDRPWTGYTQAALNYALALRAAEFPFKLQSLTPCNWRTMPEWADSLRLDNPNGDGDRDLALLHYTPHELLAPLMQRGKIRIGLTVIETDNVPHWLVRKFNEQLDGLIVPTQWTADAFVHDGLTIPIGVVPHALGSWYWEAPRNRVAFKDHYTFLYVGTWNRRKDPAAAVRAYLKATTGERTRLLIKLGRTHPQQHIAEQIAEMSDGRKDVLLYEGEWDAAQMRWLFDQSDCYLSAHRGEGWGMGLFQAALLGLDLVYAKNSAPAEFLAPFKTTDGVYPVECATVEADSMGELPYFQGDVTPLYWSRPKTDALVEAIRRAARRGPRETHRDRLNAFRRQYDYPSVGATFATVIEEVVSGQSLTPQPHSDAG